MKTDGHRQFDDPIVDVRGLAKTFTLKQKEPGATRQHSVVVEAKTIVCLRIRRFVSGSVIK